MMNSLTRGTARSFVPLASLVVLALATPVASAEDEVYSGPQPVEVLPPCPVRGVYDDLAGKDFDFVEQAGEAVCPSIPE